MSIFARIIAGEIPANKVYEDEHVVAFHDINPVAATHVLIIPRRHIVSLADATEAEQALLGKLLLAAKRVAEAEGRVAEGFRTDRKSVV